MNKSLIGTLLLIGTLGLSGCSNTEMLEGKIVRDYIGSQGEKITELVSWTRQNYRGLKAGKSQNRQLDITYPNGVHVRVVDVYDDGEIDNVYVMENPRNVWIVKYPNPDLEIMRLPPNQEFKKYFSDLE